MFLIVVLVLILVVVAVVVGGSRTGLHVPSVAEGSNSRLRGSFVESGLQSNLAVAHLSQQVFVEFAFVLLGHFRPDSRPLVLRMLLSLQANKKKIMSNVIASGRLYLLNFFFFTKLKMMINLRSC